uniref:Vacuolar protein sorting-associated protein 72 homolog n=1 Tax=Cacopsylla melanoneura TaxID=428564 RepID=A0A8D8YLA8_9HEMI
MAATREKRSNAGSKLAKLLNEEEEDEFYKTTYGGFEDDNNDDEYKALENDDDIVDSDFSIDENDEVVSDHEADAEFKRKRTVGTKAYKEPVKPKEKDKLVEKKPKAVKKKVKLPPSASGSAELERKSIRHSTAAKSAETLKRAKQQHELLKKRKRKRELEGGDQEWVMPTQDELLEEAKLTEKENKKWVESFLKMEMEKQRKNKIVKKKYTGPTITYYSTTMPLIEVLDDAISVDKNKPDELAAYKRGVHSRTFITFSSDETFNEIFPQKKFKAYPEKKKCCITKCETNYLDPVTNLPYLNAHVLKTIRESWAIHLEQHGDRSRPEVAAWLDYRQKLKDTKLKQTPSLSAPLTLHPQYLSSLQSSLQSVQAVTPSPTTSS